MVQGFRNRQFNERARWIKIRADSDLAISLVLVASQNDVESHDKITASIAIQNGHSKLWNPKRCRAIGKRRETCLFALSSDNVFELGDSAGQSLLQRNTDCR